MSSLTAYAAVQLTEKIQPTEKLHQHEPLPNLLKILNTNHKDHELFYYSAQLNDNLIPVGQGNTGADPGVVQSADLGVKYNGLIQAILHAYNEHQTLCLSPDHVWLAVAQGVSSQVNADAEKFRHLLVAHEGKKTITVMADDLRRADSLLDWRRATDRLVDAAAKGVKVPSLKLLLACDFSTTTADAGAASKMVILDVFKEYFVYSFRFTCGIPEVVLLGTLQDWQHLQTKFNQLKEFQVLGLKGWFDRLDPVISNLVETYKGNPDKEFWSTVAKRECFGSGGNTLTGWLTAFFPRDSSRNVLLRNTIGEDDLPTGRSTIPFVLDENGRKVEMSMLTGFFGCRQVKLVNRNGVMIMPSIGWAIYTAKN